MGKAQVPDTRLMLIDYGTNLEVVVSNLLMNGRKAILEDVKVERHTLISLRYSIRSQCCS